MRLRPELKLKGRHVGLGPDDVRVRRQVQVVMALEAPRIGFEAARVRSMRVRTRQGVAAIELCSRAKLEAAALACSAISLDREIERGTRLKLDVTEVSDHSWRGVER